MRAFLVAMALVGVATAATLHPQLSYQYPKGGKAMGTLEENTGGWPACDPGVTQWSGYFNINASTNKHYFYWGFDSRDGNPNAPVILWMTGGPGCSSTLAMLAENGPCHMHESNGTLYSNPYSWNAHAKIVYIDQPAGVGYSYADQAGYDHNEAEVAEDMYWFLQALFRAHPTWQQNDFFIFGESYGGHFAPATAYRVFTGNNNHDGVNLPLKGLAVGNGLVDPYVQYAYYADLAYNWCNSVLGQPCVSESTYQQMTQGIPSCQSLIKGCMANNSLDCFFARSTCNGGQIEPYQFTGRNVYDIAKPCTTPPLCYDFSAVNTFLNRADVKAALGARSDIQWQSCNMDVNIQFGNDWFQSMVPKIPPMLASGIRVLIYAGDYDFICNWIGNKHWTLAMPWSQQSAFQAAADQPWNIGGQQVALARSVSGPNTDILFTFLQVHKAGHMCPMDQPMVMSHVLSHFLGNTKFQ